MASDKRWVGTAIKHPGRLRKHYGIPEGETIPVTLLEKDAARDEAGGIPAAARLALRMRGRGKGAFKRPKRTAGETAQQRAAQRMVERAERGE